MFDEIIENESLLIESGEFRLINENKRILFNHPNRHLNFLIYNNETNKGYAGSISTPSRMYWKMAAPNSLRNVIHGDVGNKKSIGLGHLEIAVNEFEASESPFRMIEEGDIYLLGPNVCNDYKNYEEADFVKAYIATLNLPKERTYMRIGEEMDRREYYGQQALILPKEKKIILSPKNR